MWLIKSAVCTRMSHYQQEGEKIILEKDILVYYCFFGNFDNGALEIKDTNANLIAHSSQFLKCVGNDIPGAISFQGSTNSNSFLSQICFSECQTLTGSSPVYYILLPESSTQMSTANQNSAVLCGEIDKHNLLLHGYGNVNMTSTNISRSCGRRAGGPSIQHTQSAFLKHCLFNHITVCSCIVYFNRNRVEMHQCSLVNNQQIELTDVDYGIVSSQQTCQVLVSNCDFVNNTGYMFYRYSESSGLTVTDCYLEGCEFTMTGLPAQINSMRVGSNELPLRFFLDDACAVIHTCRSQKIPKIVSLCLIHALSRIDIVVIQK